MANERGTYSNPYSYSEFQEMLSAGIWNGGYVDNDGDILYYNSDGTHDNDGSEGCGCGCGEGCGCGSGTGCGSGGLIAGTESFRPSGMSADREIVITWQSGHFTSTTGPSVSAVMKDASSGQETSAMAYWESAYRVRIDARMRVLVGGEYILYDQAIYYDIPQQYRF